MVATTNSLLIAEEIFTQVIAKAANLVEWLSDRNEEFCTDLKELIKNVQEVYYQVKSKQGQMGDNITAFALKTLSLKLVKSYNNMIRKVR